LAMAEVTPFILSWIPYLNTGVITLLIDIAIERLGFKITRRRFKKEPVKSLFWGLCLIVLSSLCALIIQSNLSGFEPLVAFFILFTIYLVLTQA